jgi:uncharacterized repeat protein (TIGR01451 family)
MRKTKSKKSAFKRFLHFAKVPTLSFMVVGLVGVGLIPVFADSTPEKNAYINSSTTAENGTATDPVLVAVGDTISFDIVIDRSDDYPLVLVPTPSFSSSPTNAPVKINFINGGFEVPIVTGGGGDYFQYHQAEVSGWSTRPTEPGDVGNPDADLIEIHKPAYASGQSNLGSFASHTPDGSAQYAELNAKVTGTLYQVCTTVPGSVVYYEFYHGARGSSPGLNTDTMYFYLWPPYSTSGTPIRTCIDSYTQGSSDYRWGYYFGSYTVPAGQTETEFAFQSAAGDSLGNFLDGVRMFTASHVTLTASNNTVSGIACLDDIVTYTVEVNNDGESDASDVVMNYVLPIGTEWVPGSVAIDGVPTSFVSYNTATRELSVNVGAGATATDGGLVKGQGSFSTDCKENYSVTFQVKVNGQQIADNYLYESQAEVDYRDRNYEASTDYTNFSEVNRFGVDLSVEIIDVLPAGLTYDSNTAPTGFTFSRSGQTCTWTCDNWLTGSATVRVSAIVDSSLNTTFVNYATYQFSGDPALQTNRTYSYMFGSFTITEKYVDSAGNALIPAVADTTTEVDANDPYTKTIPTVPTYQVVGYFVGDTFSPPADAYVAGSTASIASTTVDTTVYFIYDKIIHTVTERFLEADNLGNELQAASTVNVPDSAAYTRPSGVPPEVLVKDGLVYRFSAYRIDADAIQSVPWGSLPVNLIEAVAADTTVTYLYANRLLTVTEHHVTETGAALPLPALDINTDVFEGAGYTGAAPTYSGYQYLGYFIGSSYNPTVDTYTEFSIVEIDSVLQNTTVNFIYARVADFSFGKVSETNQPISGVIFSLYTCSEQSVSGHTHSKLVTSAADCCWTNPVTATSNPLGLVTFSRLRAGDYMLVETKAASGYLLPASQWLIHVNSDAVITITTQAQSSDSKLPEFSTNGQAGFMLPNYAVPAPVPEPAPPAPAPPTGDNILAYNTVLGLMLLGATCLTIVYSKRGKHYRYLHSSSTGQK